MVLFRLLQKGLFLALLLGSASFIAPCWSESGSNQAVMVLFVPPTDMLESNTTNTTSSSPSITPNYKSDTTISQLQQSSTGVYRVWMNL